MSAFSRRLFPAIGKTGFWRDIRAGAAAEMALILPGIVFIGLNLTDLSVYIYTKMQVDLAAQEAVGAARVLCDTSAELPATVGTNCPGLTDAMLAAARTTSLGDKITLGTPIEKFYCANPASTLVVVKDADKTPPTTCKDTLTGSSAKPGDYISVTAAYTFTPVFPGASVATYMPAQITRTAWMRLK